MIHDRRAEQSAAPRSRSPYTSFRPGLHHAAIRENGLTVVAISSVNRTNYLSPIDFESLKESGGIEFTADVVWGLQFQCLNEDLFDKEKAIKQKRIRIRAARAESPRKIELCCLKNRYGLDSYSAYFRYIPQFDLFEEGFEEYPFNEPPQRAGRKYEFRKR